MTLSPLTVLRRAAGAAAALSLCAATLTHAQPAAGTSADEIVNAGLAALTRIDQDGADALWESAPAFVKQVRSKAQFVQELRQGRQALGTVSRRDWASVTRIRYAEGSTMPPAGLYANVEFATALADGRTMYEQVSFRLEPEGWRLTGYVPRQAP